MNIIKNISLCMICACCFMPYLKSDEIGGSNEPAAFENKVVAIVNGKIITMQQVRMEVAPIIAQIQAVARTQEEFNKSLESVAKSVLDDIINRIIIVEAFYERGGKIAKVYTDREYNNFISKNFNGDRVKFLEYLQAYGKSAREFRDDLTNRAIVRFMMNEIRESQTSVSPAKIKEFYDANLQKFYVDEQYDLNQIIIVKDETNSAASEKKANDLIKALDAGMTFVEASKIYNDSPVNYSIGKVSLSDLTPVLVDAIKDISPKSYSKIIDSGNSFVVVEVVSIEEARQHSLREATSDIENYLSDKYQSEAREKWLNKLRDKASIQVFM